MASPPSNQTMRTTIETHYATFGINNIDAGTQAFIKQKAAIDDASDRLSDYSKKMVQNDFIQRRQEAEARGVKLGKQRAEVVEVIPVDVDPKTGATKSGIKVKGIIMERMTDEIRDAAAARISGAQARSGFRAKAGAFETLRNIYQGMLGGPNASGANTQLQMLDDLKAAYLSGNEAERANVSPFVNFLNKNRKLLRRFARGAFADIRGEISQGLAVGDVIGAVGKMERADVDVSVVKEERDRDKALKDLKDTLLKQLARLVPLESSKAPSNLAGPITPSALQLQQAALANLINDPTVSVEDKRAQVESLKENVDELEKATKGYESAAKAIKQLEEMATKLGNAFYRAQIQNPALAGASPRLFAKQADTELFQEMARRASGGKGVGFEKAKDLVSQGMDVAKEAKKAIDQEIEDLRKSAYNERASVHREELTRRYARHPQGRSLARQMLSHLDDASRARDRGATDEATLADAKAASDQAKLESIDKQIARDRFVRMRQYGAIARFGRGVADPIAAAYSGGTAGLGESSVGLIGTLGQFSTNMAMPHLIRNGFANSSWSARAGFIGGIALAGAGAVASAAYGRGSSVLDRADASSANFLPAYEGFATANRAELMGTFTAEQHREMQEKAMLQFDDDASNSGLANYLLGPLGYADSLTDLQDAQARARRRSSAQGGPNLSDEEQAAYSQLMRQRVQEQLFSTFGQGKGNVSREQIGEALSASGRGFGTEFDVGVRPEGMTAEMFGAGSAASYANMRGLSVASIARLSALQPRFGVTNYSQIPGLVGAGGFGFRGGARDSFIDTINERVSSAALSGETPELAMRNRLYQGAVDAGGNKEQLANAYASSIGNMGDFRRGLFKGAADFSKKLMLIKAVSTGGSLQAADDLLANQGAGFTEMDRLNDAMRTSSFMADAEMRYEGLSSKTREALKASAMSGGGTVNEEPVTPESYFNRGQDVAASEADAASERSVSEKRDMANVTASFDKATSRFANAVQRFAAGILR